jgi:hypothetical protein
VQGERTIPRFFYLALPYKSKQLQKVHLPNIIYFSNCLRACRFMVII